MELSIQSIISQAIATIKNNMGFFIAIALLFFALSSLAEFAFLFLDTKNLWVFYLFALIGFALYVKQAVIIHRSVILDEVNRWDLAFKWRSPDNRFLLLCLGLWLIIALSLGLISAFVMPFFLDEFSVYFIEKYMIYILLPFFIVSGAIFCRICLTLPSRAVGGTLSFGESINLTKSNGIKMFVLIILLPIATNLLVGVLLSEDTLVYNLFISFIAHVVVVFQVSVLSHTYMELTHKESQDKPEEMKV